MKFEIQTLETLPATDPLKAFDLWRRQNPDFVAKVIDIYERAYQLGYRGKWPVRSAVNAVSWENIQKQLKPLTWNAELSAQLGRYIIMVNPKFKVFIQTASLYEKRKRG